MAEPVAPPSTMVVGNEIKKRFLEWAASEPGVDVSPDVDLFHEFKEGYRGVVATKDIAADVVLVRVARSCCVGPETTDASHQDWKEVLASADVMNTSSGDGKAAPPRLTRACLTVLQLLHERGRGKASPFFPYLSVLPHDHRLPMEWNETELQLLQGTSVEPLVGTGSLDSQFEAFQRVVALHPTMWEPSVCTKAAFAKGINWVRSRGFTVLGDPHMIPGADMFNHDPDKQSVQIGTDGEDFFVMKTVHPVKAGEELFSSFGHISNAQLLNSYGFVLPGNSFDTVLIPTQLVVDTCYATFVNLEGKKLGEEEVKATWARRLAMLASNVDEGEGQEEAFLVSKYDLVPESLADMVQILTMSGDEEVVYATIAAVAQAKMGQYSPLLDAGKTTAAAAGAGGGGGGGECAGGGTEGAEGAEGAEGEKRQAIGADARTVAEMLVAEEKKVLGDLRVQLMSEILNDAEDDSDDQEQDDEDDASAAREGNKGSKRRKAA